MATKMKLILEAVHPSDPKAGDLCVWNMTDPPHKMDRYAVRDLAEAKDLIRRLTTEQLKDDSIVCNAFGLEVYEGENFDWEEWEDTDGNSITDLMDAEDEEKE